MVRVAICDDDRSITEALSLYLEQKNRLLQDTELGVTIYHSGEDFLRDIESGALFHIVFMDIQMDGMSGIDVGQRLRNQTDSDDTIIIYISSYNAYSDALLEVGSYRFIRKPIQKDKLDKVFSRAIVQVLKYQIRRNNPRTFLFNVHKEIHSINVDEIAYIMSLKKTMEIYAWDKATKEIFHLERFYSSVAATIKQLPREQFIQCNRTHIINFDYVQRVAGDYFMLMDRQETKIQIGRKFSGEARDRYVRYRRTQYE